MPVDELAALLRVVTLIADLDPANAWELDAQLDGLAKVTAKFAEGLGTWGERLAEIGLHDSVTAVAGTGSDHLGQTAEAFTDARQTLRTVYAAQFAAAEAQVRQVDRRDFWGETPNGAGGGTHASSPAVPDAEPVDEPVTETEVQSGAMNMPGGTYLDWSCSTEDGGRQLEVGDGDGSDANVVQMDLTPDQLRELCKELHLTLNDDGQAADFVSMGDDDRRYIDWSTPLPGGGRQIEIGDADGNAVNIEFSRDELQALHDQLTEDIAEPSTAAAAGDQAAGPDIGPGGLWLGDVNAGLVGWGSAGPAGGRSVELDNGQDIATVGLTHEQIRELRDRLAATLDGDQAVDAQVATEAGTVSWQADGEGYRLRVDAGDDHSETVLTEQQLRAVQQQIATDLAQEDAAAATFPGVTGRLADKRAGVSLDNDSQLTVPAGALPDDQVAAVGRAVRLYRNSTYRHVGAYLRGGEDEVLEIREQVGQQDPSREAISEHVALIDQAMQAAPLDQPLELWRGVHDLPLVLGTDPGEDLTGVEWTEQSFPSTSVDPAVASIFSDGDVLLRLHAPAGTGAIQLDSRATELAHNREAEVLLQRGLQMRIVADQRQTVGEGHTVGLGGGTQYVPPREYRVLDVEVTVPKPAVPEPSRSAEEIRPPNGGWGIDQGLMHFDGALGRLWNNLGDDQHLQVDGRALGNIITDLGEGITRRKHDTNHAARELRRIRTQLPDGSGAARSVDVALDRLAAPDRPAPALPDKAPQQLKDLMGELNAIPLVRRGYDEGSGEAFHETDRLAEATNRWMNGEIGRSQLERELESLLRGRHESQEGWTEIKVAVGRALADFRQWARRPD